LEELAEATAKTIIRTLGFVVRALVWLIWEMFFHVIGWYAGWPVCRVLTLGTFPQEGISQHEEAGLLTHFVVSMLGLLSLIALGFWLTWLTELMSGAAA
tara:strand:+ start:3398 stop:3694 length:297 start_codon:yes stop_codon:yes gene_type:complete